MENQNKTSVVALSREFTDEVMDQINILVESKAITLPTNYAVGNVFKNAFITLQQVETKDHKPALSVCTRQSISIALLDMAVQGLDPAKKQCYFVAYGNKIVLMRSYFGTVTALKRIRPDVDGVVAQVVHDGEEFSFSYGADGMVHVDKHANATLATLNKPIVAAYANILDKDKNVLACGIMTKAEIEAAWKQGYSGYDPNKLSDTHVKFAQEMAKKTVINRTCKMLINTSDDESLLAAAYNRTTENEYMRNVTPEEERKRLPQGHGAVALKAKLKAMDEPEQEPEPAVSEPEEAMDTKPETEQQGQEPVGTEGAGQTAGPTGDEEGEPGQQGIDEEERLEQAAEEGWEAGRE
jgi:recombination protein RecT